MQTALRQLFFDFLSAIVFITLYSLTGNLYLGTAVAIAVSATQVAIAKVRGKPIDAMQWLVLGLVLVLGGATLITQDSRFIMAKPSLIHTAIGVVLLRPGWMGRYLPDIARDNLPARAIVIAGYCWAALMFVLAMANLVVATTMPFYVWGWFVAFGLIGAKLAAFAIQYAVMRPMVVRRIRARTAPAE